MSSRRVRRHATGASNATLEGDGTPSGSRNTVSLIHADRLVKVHPRERPADPAARETRVEDRPVLNKVHDKLFQTFRVPYVHKVLRSYAADGSGLLTPDQLRAAMERLHLGLGEEERERIVARVAPAQHDRVHYMDFLRWLDIPAPLGGEDTALGRGTSVPGPPTVRPGGGGHGVRDGGQDGTYWNWKRHPEQYMPGLLAGVAASDGGGQSPEQAASDEALCQLLRSKLRASQRHKLRDVFRRLDADRNSVLDREEFARGVASLGIPASRAQLDRLFELVDTDGDGVIDYGEWAARFEERGRRELPEQTYKASSLHPAAATATAGAATLPPPEAAAPPPPGPSPDEVSSALRDPLVQELARSLYGKGAAAVAVFQRRDATRSGRLGLRELTACCQALVPGIQENQVAALAAALEPLAPPATSSTSRSPAYAAAAASPAAAAAAAGHVDYRSFVEGLLGGAAPHPRLLHSAPAGGGTGGGGGGGGGIGVGTLGTLARFGEPSSIPPPTLPGHRSLSAMGLSHPPDDEASGPAVPPPLGAVPSDRTTLYDIHDVAVRPFLESLDRAAASDADGSGGGGPPLLPSVTRSVDMGTLGRSRLRRQQRQRTEGGGGWGGGSQAPSHATGRFSRFWDQRYADTNHVTVADPDCAAAPPPGSVWVRKDENDAYLRFQQADREHTARRRQQLALRYANRSAIDTAYSGQDDASGADEGRLAHMRALRQRYEERSEMYDRVRQSDADKAETCFFNRQPAHHEHQLEGANTPQRFYW